MPVWLNRALPSPSAPVEVAWEAFCPKCDSGFEIKSADQPCPHGLFCPECRRRNYVLKGILHFTRVYPLAEIDKLIASALARRQIRKAV